MDSAVDRVSAIIVTACICILLTASQCGAGAWTMGKGQFYERVAFNYYYADEQFGVKKSWTTFRSFTDMNVSNYFEYGITDRFTLINALYYKDLEKQEAFSNVDASGVGDIDLGLKAKLLEGSWGVLSTQGLAKFPGFYDKNDALPLGNGQYDTELRVLYGRSLYPFPGYVNFEIGYRWRLDDPSDELRYLAEFGMDFTRDLYGRIKLDGILSMDNGAKNGAGLGIAGNPTATNSFDLGKLDIALGYRLTKAYGLELVYTPEIYGRNTTQGATYTLAFTYQFK
ncbi:MAG: hypothetical protein WAW37_02650 [Syntrophobacteraceae bacterium]